MNNKNKIRNVHIDASTPAAYRLFCQGVIGMKAAERVNDSTLKILNNARFMSYATTFGTDIKIVDAE